MLNEKTITTLEENDIRIYDREEPNGEYCRDIEFYSDAGEDFCRTLWYDGTDSGFIESFRQLADDFNADEHAEIWIHQRGRNGVPATIRELVDDADNIKNKLLSVAEQLDNINRKRTVILTESDRQEHKKTFPHLNF